MGAEFLVILAILSYGTSSILQKYALQKMKKLSVSAVFHSHMWLASIIAALVGMIAYLGALKYGNFSFVQTALSATFVVPIIGGTLLLKEKLSVMEWISVVLTSIGIILYSV